MMEEQDGIAGRKGSIDTLRKLLSAGKSVQLVNVLTLYRTLAFPLLIVLVLEGKIEIFKWLLIISFMTDAVDGFLARKLEATSTIGSILDSIGDDLTILAGTVGLIIFRLEFIKQEIVLLLVQLCLFFIQMMLALYRYKRVSSFHTYLAKAAAIAQGFFLCSMFLFERPIYWLFYLATVVTTMELLEEILIVIVLPKWQTNVRGFYWVWQSLRHPTVDKNH